jgi:hypothetical protein
VPLKVVLKPACDSEIVLKAGHECTLEKFTNERKGKPEQKFVFKEASKNFILIFL